MVPLRAILRCAKHSAKDEPGTVVGLRQMPKNHVQTVHGNVRPFPGSRKRERESVLQRFSNVLSIMTSNERAGRRNWPSRDLTRAWRRRSRSSSPGGGKNFHFSMSSRPALGSTQPPIQWVPGAPSLGVKRQGREAGHSPPTSAEVNKIWIYTSTPPYAFMLSTGTTSPFLPLPIR
jgi:hypothetical protein